MQPKRWHVKGSNVMERLGDVWVVNDWGWLVPLAIAAQGRVDGGISPRRCAL